MLNHNIFINQEYVVILVNFIKKMDIDIVWIIVLVNIHIM